MPGYRIRNRSNKPITDGQKSLPPGGEFEFGDVCAAVRFVNGAGTSFLENTPGEVVQRINRAAARAGPRSSRSTTGVTTPARTPSGPPR